MAQDPMTPDLSTPRKTEALMKWKSKPAQHDFAAARSYLTLNFTPVEVKKLVKALVRGETTHFKAKDLLRATRLPLLPQSNPDVKKELDRIASGEPLSPCLIIRGKFAQGQTADIADGYHRICASNYVNEDADIPVRLVGW